MRHDLRRRRLLAGIAAGLLVGAVAIVLWQPGETAPVVLAATMQAPIDGGADEPPLDLAALLRSSLDDDPARVERVVERTPVVESIVEHPDLARWVEDLRDDGMPRNGLHAVAALWQLPPGRLPQVEAALRSPDAQQRHFAAHVLRRRAWRSSPVSDDLLRVAVEGLRSDVHLQMPGLEHLPTASLYLLLEHADAAAALLRRALDGNNEQQRFLSAFALTRAAVDPLAPRIAQELVRHLGHNDIGGDALMAVNGLYRLGNAAMPTVREWRPFVDHQARTLLDLVELDLRDPPRDLRALRARAMLHDVTHIYHDPAIEYQVGRSPVAHWGR